MGCQDGSGTVEDRTKVTELRERILQLAGHDCHEDEKSRIELQEDLNMCKRDILIELCHSFDMSGSRANRKDELVSFLMKLLKDNCSRIDTTIPVKVSDLREQFLQLSEPTYHEEEEKLQTELLERLNVCKRDTLIELCRSFGIIGSRANRKEELVSFLMKFVKDHSSGIDGTNHDKKIMKRRHLKEENLSSGKPPKKKKHKVTALETQDEEAYGCKEDRRNYPECNQKDNRYISADNKNGIFPNDETNLEPSVRIDVSLSENVNAVTQNEVLVHTNEQALTTSPSAKVVAVGSTNVKASKKKNSCVAKKKATPNKHHKVNSCGKKGYKGDVNPRKLAMKPSRDELREAIVLILDATDFATMTFGDVVKAVDKYFGKDLFERKPLIRSLIEEELFRLSEEAEKNELEEEAAEAKARTEQTAKETAQVRTVETVIDKRNKHKAGQNCETRYLANNTNGYGNEKDVKGGSSASRNSSDVAEVSQNGNVNADTKIVVNECTKDGKCGKASPCTRFQKWRDWWH